MPLEVGLSASLSPHPVAVRSSGPRRETGLVAIRLLIRRFWVRLPGGAQQAWSAMVNGRPSRSAERHSQDFVDEVLEMMPLTWDDAATAHP